MINERHYYYYYYYYYTLVFAGNPLHNIKFCFLVTYFNISVKHVFLEL